MNVPTITIDDRPRSIALGDFAKEVFMRKILITFREDQSDEFIERAKKDLEERWPCQVSFPEIDEKLADEFNCLMETLRREEEAEWPAVVLC